MEKSKEIDAYYRFTLGRETYSSQLEAEDRLHGIQNPPPANSLVSKSCNIITGFRIDQVVYFVHTDVGVFRDEMQEIAERLLEDPEVITKLSTSP